MRKSIIISILLVMFSLIAANLTWSTGSVTSLSQLTLVDTEYNEFGFNGTFGVNSGPGNLTDNNYTTYQSAGSSNYNSTYTYLNFSMDAYNGSDLGTKFQIVYNLSTGVKQYTNFTMSDYSQCWEDNDRKMMYRVTSNFTQNKSNYIIGESVSLTNTSWDELTNDRVASVSGFYNYSHYEKIENESITLRRLIYENLTYRDLKTGVVVYNDSHYIHLVNESDTTNLVWGNNTNMTLDNTRVITTSAVVYNCTMNGSTIYGTGNYTVFANGKIQCDSNSTGISAPHDGDIICVNYTYRDSYVVGVSNYTVDYTEGKIRLDTTWGNNSQFQVNYTRTYNNSYGSGNYTLDYLNGTVLLHNILLNSSNSNMYMNYTYLSDETPRMALDCYNESHGWFDVLDYTGGDEVFDFRMFWNVPARESSTTYTNVTPAGYYVSTSTSILFNFTVNDTEVDGNYTEFNCSLYTRNASNNNWTVNPSLDDFLVPTNSHLNRTITFQGEDRIYWHVACEDKFHRNIGNTSQRIFDVDEDYQTLSLGVGSTVNFTLTTGDMSIKGDFKGNQYYGEMWNYTNNASTWTFAIDTAGIYHNLSGLGQGSLNGFTFSDSVASGSTLTATVAGNYMANAAVSFEGLGNNQLYSWAIVKNNDVTLQRNCYSRRYTSIQSTVASSTVSCILPLVVGDIVTLQVENEDSATDVNIHAINVNLMRIGD